MGKEIMLYIKQTVDGNIRVDHSVGVVKRADISPLCTIVNEVDKAIIYGELSSYHRKVFNELYVVSIKVDSELFNTVMDIIGRGGQ